ncbi:P27 family phage terminase small subunit [Actinomyces procaprae]|uniref:P27 family phage terminase small subunit n=1 Tax=Actinomyces procaprae TaxID=2560010 RepID=UPI001445C583|nr:P27 family phage terminase small subunit [Actinomyces procaprae]
MADIEPPQHVTGGAAQVWRDVVAAHPKPGTLDSRRLEAYCYAVDHLRRAHQAVAEEGLTVEDARGQVVKNPALAAAKEAQEQIRRWGAEFTPPHPPRRRRGTMYDATTASITAADHLSDGKYRGACEAVKTLAWLIDEAQRAGIEALQKTAFGAIPAYLKGCADLQITPAALPEDAARPKRRGEGRLKALRGGLASASGQ